MLVHDLMSNLPRYLYVYYRKLITYSYYKISLSSLGQNVFIGKPLYFTCKYIIIRNGVYLWPNCRIEGISVYLNKKYTPSIVIEDFVSIQQNLHLTCANEVIIGKETAIAANVTITDINHSYLDINIPPEKQNIEVAKVNIGEACKIYNNAVILPGVFLGRHTIVAANSVVTSGEYPAYCVLAGVPAKIIKRYCFDQSKWRRTNIYGDFFKE